MYMIDESKAYHYPVEWMMVFVCISRDYCTITVSSSFMPEQQV